MVDLQRKAQWRLDFVAAENSMGFHAPQELARILGESIDYSRQAQLEAMNLPGCRRQNGGDGTLMAEFCGVRFRGPCNQPSILTCVSLVRDLASGGGQYAVFQSCS